MCWLAKSTGPRTKPLGSNCQLCDLGQVTKPQCLDFPISEMGIVVPFLQGDHVTSTCSRKWHVSVGYYYFQALASLLVPLDKVPCRLVKLLPNQ